MEKLIIPAVIGVICIILGISNMRGNISSLHSYHRHRVSEEDRLPFGKKVGLGTVIIGCGAILFSIFSAIAQYLELPVFNTVATVVLIAGLIAGLGISFYAMIKYNKGIF